MKMGCFLLLLLIPWLVSAQNLTRIEYYFDVDPGQGNGIPVSFTQDSLADLSFSATTSGLENGFHRIFFRAQDANGKWGLPQSKSFILASQNPLIKNKIRKLEYFFDHDPGYGNGTLISFPADTLDDRFLVAVPSGLAPGFHKVYFRYQDETGGWSLDHSRGFLLAEQSPLFSAKVSGLEYYFDSDPGQGAGFPISINPDTVVLKNISVSLSELSPGFHAIYFRAKTELGLWGIPVMKPLLVEKIRSDSTDKVQMVETFFDSDPGFGNGQLVSVTPATRLTDSLLIHLSGLSPGIHNLGIRVKTISGAWSFTTNRSFVKQGLQNDTQANVAKIEYFSGDDPGFGNGTPILILPSPKIEQVAVLDLSGLKPGFHLIRVRVADDQGNWSFLSNRPVWVDAGEGSVSAIEQAEWQISKGGSVLSSGKLPASGFSQLADWIADLPISNAEIDSSYQLDIRVINKSGIRSLGLTRKFSVRQFKNILISWKNQAARDSIASVLISKNLDFDELDRSMGDTSWVNWKTIFWDEPLALTEKQRKGLKRFLDQKNERSLILAGENVVSSHDLTGSEPDTTFLYSYLRSKAVTGDINGSLPAISIVGEGISSGLTSTLSSVSPDAMTPVNGSLVAARYSGISSPDSVAGVYFNGSANVAVLGFGFNQVSESETGRFLDGIPDWLNQSGGTLPVEFAGFSGYWTGKSILLTWTTLSETGNAGFQIQMKKTATGENGMVTTDWIPVGFIEGAGTTQTAHTYQYSHSFDAKRGNYTYRLVQIDLNGQKSAGEPISIVVDAPETFVLSQNYPNPFNSSTVIKFQIPVNGQVSLEIFNILGQRIKTLVNQPLMADYYSYNWDSRDDADKLVATGQYFYRISAGKNTKILKMVILK